MPLGEDPDTRERRWRRIGVISGGLVLAKLAMLAIVAGAEIASLCRSRVPPPELETIDGFAARFFAGKDVSYWTFERDGETFLEVRQRLPFYMLPSGPTAYVFDSDGRFRDWVIDNGESTRWNERWGQIGRSPTTAEAVLGPDRAGREER